MSIASGSRFGEFETRRLLGKGGMGEVWEAYQLSLGRSVALKVLPEWMSDDDRAREGFQREAAITAQLDHSNIVPIYAFGLDQRRCYFAMKLIRGLSLWELIKRWQNLRHEQSASTPVSGRQAETVPMHAETSPLHAAEDVANELLVPVPSSLDPNDIAAMRGVCAEFIVEPFRFAARVGQQLARALAYAHARGQIHRDVKPSNAMIDRHGQVYLIDFGLMRSLAQTISHPAAGTPRYLSPEQLDLKELDGRTDIYSLGVTLYEVVSRTYAYSGGNTTTLAAEIRSGAARPLREVTPHVPDRLARAIERAMQPDRNARYQTAEEFADALAESGETTAKSEATIPFLLPTKGLAAANRRHRWFRRAVIGLAATAAIAVLVLAGSSALSPRGPSSLSTDPRDLSGTNRAEFGKWHKLMLTEPELVVRQGFPEDMQPFFTPARQEFHVDTRGQALYRLGSADVPAYVLQVGIRQNNWLANTGVFFGLHDVELPDGQPGLQCQQIRLEVRPGSNGEPPTFFIHRRSVSYVVKAEGSVSERSRDLAWEELEPPERGEQMLEVTVGSGKLERVRWAGRDLPALVTPEVNAVVQPADYTGDFGLFNANSSTVFTSTQIKYIRRPFP